MEYEVIVSIYPKGQEDADPIREETILETADLTEANALVEDAIDLCEDDPEEEDESPGIGPGTVNSN